jgi:hypothetical protein
VPITERDKTRLDALIAIVKPANSLAARLDTLNDDQRDWYDGWKAHCERWMSRNDERAYEITLNGGGPISLREDITTALFGEMPRILKTDDDDKAAQIYQRYCND